ncbi:hypothetical protein M885DRAFT_625201 [Pelagophyceae sp. CCMP2097]|nr:hypothetical protein M885DRAFT_625201 [Pelagophyceae sp. CCMP2097]|mmetsp:Transcript_7724/g.25210  ORF Transcript_7724/g.25210 Transcript_7724/m.25210 type:complete len:321 (+) Transcript_7724:132-1094(+)
MSGRLVILPKKSWNVWNPANIEKVRKDEAAAAEQDAQTAKADRDAAMAANISIMKGEAPPPPDEPAARGGKAKEGKEGNGFKGKGKGDKAKDGGDALFDARGHVNFFAEEERLAATALDGRTPEEAAYHARVSARETRSLGFFAQPVALKEPEAPWYAQKVEKRRIDPSAEASLETPSTRKAQKRLAREDRKRRELDPMRGLVVVERRPRSDALRSAAPDARLRIGEHGRADAAESSSSSSDDSASESSGRAPKAEPPKAKRRKAEEDRAKRKKKKKKAAAAAEAAFDELRQKRLDREARERPRALRLLASRDSGGDLGS